MLHIHRSERADRLADALAEVLADPLADPLAPEVVAVPSRGVERWLSQRLSARLGARAGRQDGVAANIDFPFPGRLVGGALRAAEGPGGWPADRHDAWRAERAVWPLLALVDGCLHEPWLTSLAAHLGGGDGSDPVRGGRRFATVRHLADLYDRYGVHRPELLRAWARGEDGAPSAAAWQPELWRRLRARVGTPSPAERLEDACRLLREGARPSPGIPLLAELPERVAIFGLTRLPASYLQVLRAIAHRRDVHLFLLHPSPVLWSRVAAACPAGPPSPRRADDPTRDLPRNPLLASWGRDAREMQLVVAGEEPARDHHHPLAAGGDTLLARIQADVRADRAPPGLPAAGADDARPVLRPDDRSLQVHSCHGRARQVEVVRDAILHHMAEDPTLEPRDVIVMCPDIEAFAPLVHAVFGAGADDEDPGGARPPVPDLRVRLADRSLRQTNPLLGVVAELLELASARVTASQVLDLAGREPVRRRFGLDDDELARMEEWAAATGVRWGLHAAHRAPFRLERVAANTWRAGLDRVLLGVAMDESDRHLLGGALPLDDVESGAIDLAGRLAELLDRLEAALAALAGPQSAAAWADAIAGAADALAAVGDEDAWQRAQLERLLDELVEEATAGGAPSPVRLALPEVRALLADRLRGRPTRAGFRTGHLTVCTLVPMRSVPHRVVCLLGLDDEVFPRAGARDGDDLLLADPHVGDPDARGEDRQLLLDALLAATDRLVVTYAGRDERTNAERPPAVPVGELLDVVDRTVRREDGGGGEHARARGRIVVRHPLQPFDARNFTAGELVGDRPWGFDRVALDAARAAAGPRRARPPFLAGRLAEPDAPALELERLVRFLAHPVRAFLRDRLGVRLDGVQEDPPEGLPVELDPLESWGVGDRLLAARLEGADPTRCLAAERARGILPPGVLAERVLADVVPCVDGIVAEVARLGRGPSDEAGSVEVNLALPDGRRVTGSVPGVHGDLVLAAIYSRVGPKHRLAAWARLLALSAARPDRPWRVAIVGRAASGARAKVVRMPPLPGPPAARAARAREHLATLADLLARGMREPLPLYCLTSHAYATAVAGHEDPVKAAAGAWSGGRWGGEDAEPEHVLVLGGRAGIGELLGPPPAADEHGDGWAADEATRLGRYARRLWDDLLAHEVVDR